MNRIRTVSKYADRTLGLLTALLAAVLLLYSAYVIFDNYYKGQSAFSSWELQQYKPSANTDTTPDFQEIQELNPDVVGWVTIYDTNIDYPVAQGEDDLEYINKDIYGKGSLTGSIYLSAENNGDFSNNYNIIYGHHMDNGAMFGDIDKFADEEYFLSHREGELLTPDGGYALNVFACLRTDAYESRVYSVIDDENRDLTDILDFIKENADQYYELENDKINKLIAFSTCASTDTNGRILIFANATPKQIVAGTTDSVPAISQRVAVGHNTGMENWSLLNLACVLITLLTLLPISYTSRKYRQYSYSKNKAKEIRETLRFVKKNKQTVKQTETAQDEDINVVDITEKDVKRLKKIVKDLRHFLKMLKTGIIAEIIVTAAAIIAFLLTENIQAPMVLSDSWTWLMVLIAATGIIFDFIFFRYRGILPPKELSAVVRGTPAQA